MSTYRDLAQKLRQETTDAGTGPSSVVAQTGENKRFVDWIADAWSELQQERDDWKWMRKSFTVPTVADTSAYAYDATGLTDTVSLAAITRFGRWYRNTFKAYLQSDGVGVEYPLTWMEWDRFRRIYRYGTQTSQQPRHVSIQPNGAFVLGPAPEAVYVVSGDYQIGPQIMTLDADIPEMPTRFHNLIVYEAMTKYGGKQIAVESMVRAQSEGGRLRFALELQELPSLTYGQALA